MDIQNIIYKNHRKEIDAMLSTINGVLDSPNRQSLAQVADGKRFFCFDFQKFVSQKYVLPYLRQYIMNKGEYSEVKWDISDKFNKIYLYVYCK